MGVVRNRLKLKLGSTEVDGQPVYQIINRGKGNTGALHLSASRPQQNGTYQDQSGQYVSTAPR